MTLEKSIGIFDSGMGGLSVAAEIRRQLPYENITYFADSKHAPYGEKSQAYILERCRAIIKILIEKDCKMIVLACNTATVSGISKLREEFQIPIVGVEPAIKPAVKLSQTKKIAALVTQRTSNSERFLEFVAKYRPEAEIILQACPGFVEQVEAEDLTSQQTKALVLKYVAPLRDQNVDVIVLGCTHYPFLRPLIQDIAGPNIQIISTEQAIAREVTRQLRLNKLQGPNTLEAAEMLLSSAENPKILEKISRLYQHIRA